MGCLFGRNTFRLSMCELFSSNTLGFETSGLLGSERLLLYARGLFHGFLLGLLPLFFKPCCLYLFRLFNLRSQLEELFSQLGNAFRFSILGGHLLLSHIFASERVANSLVKFDAFVL